MASRVESAVAVNDYFLQTAAMALAAFATGAGDEPRDQPVPVYQCEHSERLPKGGYSDLRVLKSFREDGSVYGMQVEWDDNQGSLVRLTQPGDRAHLSLKWPGDHRISAEGEPFDWSHGSIKVSLIAANGANLRNLKGEKWKRIIVTRDDSVRIYGQDGTKQLMLMGFNLHLASDLEHLGSPGWLTMPLGSLLAWGSGVERVTVYETRVTRRKQGRNAFPDSPIGRSRIVGAYELEPAALERMARLVREATLNWEAEVAKRWRNARVDSRAGQSS